MYDSILLRDLRVFAAVGAERGERELRQELLLDIELTLEASRARASDRLETGTDYADLHARLTRVGKTETFALLERLGDRLLVECVRDACVLWASVTLTKPGLLGGASPSVVLIGRRATRVAIGLGGNLGDVPATIARAVEELRAIGDVVAQSSLYRTKAWGPVAQPDFYNAAVIVETRLMPHAILAALKGIEHRLGREHGIRYGPRTIDCDILDDEGMQISDGVLIVPHPRLAERAFVLAPLSEIAPQYRQAWDALPESERDSVRLVTEVKGT